MANRLTDAQIRALKPVEGKRVELFDLQEPGLLLRLSDRGQRTWFWRYRLPDGRQPRFKLGTYPATGIADARGKAQDARRVLEGGGDPAGKARTAKREAKAQRIRTFGELVDVYFEASEAGTWTPKGKAKRKATIQTERELYVRHIKKALGGRALKEIGRPELKELTRAMLNAGIRTQTNHVHAFIRQVFSFGVEEAEVVTANPALGMKSPAPKKARDRVLSDDELKSFWGALLDPAGLRTAKDEKLSLSEGMSIALRLVVLLLQRRAEVASMRIADVDLGQGVWIIPGEVAKNGRAHSVPLAPAAVQLIKDAVALKSHGGSPYVFPSPRNRQGHIHPDALTRSTGAIMKALGFPLAGPHDLRRTGASIMASERLGVQPFVVSQVLNHITDAGGGSATTRAHYNVHTYAAEKRRALGAWEALLLAVVEGVEPHSNVAPFTKKMGGS